jgi:NADH-quinone oxidoreductase subunit F
MLKHINTTVLPSKEVLIMAIRDIITMRKAHETLCEFEFEIPPLKKGYANRTLRIDLDKNDISIQPVSEEMKRLWVGGKGFDLWLMLQEITKNTKWDSNENPICFATGPLGGTTSFPGSGKTLVTSISPVTNSIMDSNVGGHFGPFFKFAGFDALTIVGKAREDVIILIDGTSKKVTIEKAPLESIDSHVVAEELTEMYADNEADMKNIAVVSAGKAADHTLMGILNFSFWDWRRGVARLKQAGRGGIGTVFRDKNIKAVIAKNRDITPGWRLEVNKVARLTTPRKISIQTCGSEIETIQKIISQWNSDPEFIIEMMQDIQDEFRHISKTAIDKLCKYTKTPKSYIYHIATFYKSFSLEPKGETLIQVCLGTACHVKGAMNILHTFERILDTREGGTTKDKKYSLEAVRCLGACSIAPVIKIGNEVIGNVRAKDVEKIIKKHKKEKKDAGIQEKDKISTKAARITKNSLTKIAKREKEIGAQYKGMLMVCTGTGCVSAKGFTIRDSLQTLLKNRNLHKDYLVVGTGCNGFCAVGPIVVVQPEGIFYQKVTEKNLDEIVDNHLQKGNIVKRLLFKDPVTKKVCKKITDIEFFNKQELLALRNKGLIDPENIDHYISHDGYKALTKVLEMNPENIVEEIIKSGIRGRGGGGFPTGIKWESCRKSMSGKNGISYVVCNADEGDPGAFMDRSIIETDPHSVIEGMLIGARAVNARNGYIYIRKEYPLALKRLKHAISQARQRGLLGEKILGTDFSFEIEIHRGAGAFVCGESTALMASMSGKPGEPRAKYVHNVEFGYRNRPTVLNNVETWANIPLIINKGAQWFSGIGTGDVRKNPWNGSSGTKAFSLVGNINNTGLVEVPMGITLREIIYEIGGGIPGGRKFKAVQTGGPSGGCLPERFLDVKIDFDTLTEAGSMMGSGGMIVMDDKTCMVDVAKYFIHFLIEESCGKCTPCREGLFALGNTLTKICNGRGCEDDLKFLKETSSTISETSLCQLGATAVNPVLSTLKYFREEYEAHIKENRCPAGVCKPLITYSINDNCTGCILCKKGCPSDAITGEKKEKHVINSEKCIKCGICFENCNFNAVEVK